MSESDSRVSAQGAERAAASAENAKLLQELRIYQAELEMQNDQLRQTQLELERSRNHYRVLFARAPIGYMLLTPAGVVREANAAATVVLHCSREELVGRLFLPWIANEHHVELVSNLQRATASSATLDVDARLAHGDGWVRVEAARIDHAGDEATLVLCVISDISARKRAEAALRASEERHRAVFESTRDGICLVDPRQDLILDANAAAEAIFGRDGRVLLAARWSELAGRRVPSPIDEHPIELAIARPDGTRVDVEAAFGLARLTAGSVVLVSLRNVSERRRAQAERDKLEDDLRHAQRLEALGRFSGGVAHDFNNLLTVIGANASLARQERAAEQLPDPAALDDVLLAVKRATELVQGLLAFGRRQQLQPRVLDARELVQRMERLLVRMLGADVALRVSTDEREARVEVDAASLEQTLMNLVGNARQAMPHGGRLFVRVSRREVAASTARLPLEPGEYVALEVEDEGPGIEPDTLARIFEPFFSTRPAGEGTGLGLAMAYGFARQSGGALDVTSAPGKGSCFTVLLPRVGVGVSPEETSAAELAPHGNEEILLVEDDALVRGLLTRVLGRGGYVVHAAASRDEAVAHAKRRGGAIALVLTDVTVPETNGVEIVRALTAFCPDARVLFAAGYASDVLERYGLRARDLEFVTKPFEPNDLLVRIRKLLELGGPRVCAI